MFELPDAKRVRRSELHSPHSSPSASRSPSPTTAAYLQSRLASLYGPLAPLPTSPPVSAAPAPVDPQPAPESPADEGFEFRLFAAPKKGKAVTGTEDVEKETDGKLADTSKQSRTGPRIRIASPSPGAQEGGFVKPHRPRGYYFTCEEDAGGSRQEEWVDAAVGGETVRKWAGQRWPGCALPWRVKLLPRPQFRVQVFEEAKASSEVRADKEVGRKPKPNKKRRIVLRRRVQARKEKEEVKSKSQEEKEKEEREEREKRTRRNREKKVKKKIKEKQKKLEERSSLPRAEKMELDGEK